MVSKLLKNISIVIIEIPKKNIISLSPIYYMPQDPQHTIIQIALKHYNHFRSVRKEAF